MKDFRRAPSCTQHSSSGGFSLVELMVVLMMLALLAGVSAPAVGRYYENLDYRRETARIVSVLRYARLTAVSRGQEVRLSLADEKGAAIRLTGAVQELRPAATGEQDRVAMRPREIVFHPEGGATPGMLTYTRGERSRSILLDPLTGLPRIN